MTTNKFTVAFIFSIKNPTLEKLGGETETFTYPHYIYTHHVKQSISKPSIFLLSIWGLFYFQTKDLRNHIK
jgi:hypothetical protein